MSDNVLRSMLIHFRDQHHTFKGKYLNERDFSPTFRFCVNGVGNGNASRVSIKTRFWSGFKCSSHSRRI